MFARLFNTRHSILLVIISFYFFPLMFLTIYGTWDISFRDSWEILSIGLLIASLGSLTLFVIMQEWEKTLVEANPIPLPVKENQPADTLTPPIIDNFLFEEAQAHRKKAEEELSESKIRETSLQAEVSEKSSEIINLTKEKERFQRQSEQILQELQTLKETSEEKLEQNRIFLNEYQQTINEQRSALEAKHHLVGQLESKVRDLTYEIKTLLQLVEKARTLSEENTRQGNPENQTAEQDLDTQHESDEDGDSFVIADRPVSTESEAAQQLRRYVDIAQKITGANHYNSPLSRMKDLPIDSYALDFRRLFDSLRSENVGTVFVYSQKENRFLFINSKIKGLLGWSPEKFLQNFPDIIRDSGEDWGRMLAQLAYKNDVQARLFLKTKAGQAIPINCHLGVVPTGVFRSTVIGILY